jgi:type IV secretory pathway TrbD component
VRLRGAAAVMAVMCGCLAAICVWLALAWRREHAEVVCWRAFVEEQVWPASGDCRAS